MTATLELEPRLTRPPLPRELWCRECGYGVVVRGDPPACPMCRASRWREQPRLSHAR